mmetsp:Transcript_29577/g.81310  ORF Transcript_29577/g.81310 Transcript_29577/m.81310 type:complete len:95 (-) Transcript_29577:2133-2417(-)
MAGMVESRVERCTCEGEAKLVADGGGAPSSFMEPRPWPVSSPFTQRASRRGDSDAALPPAAAISAGELAAVRRAIEARSVRNGDLKEAWVPDRF